MRDRLDEHRMAVGLFPAPIGDPSIDTDWCPHESQSLAPAAFRVLGVHVEKNAACALDKNVLATHAGHRFDLKSEWEFPALS